MVESGVQWSFSLVILDLQDQNSRGKLNFVVPVVFPRYQVGNFVLEGARPPSVPFYLLPISRGVLRILRNCNLPCSDSATTDQCYFPEI